MLSDEIKIWIDVEETMNWKQSSSSSFLFLECDLSVCRKRWIKRKKQELNQIDRLSFVVL